MGLLSRVEYVIAHKQSPAAERVSSIDTMGKVVRERISRLSVDKHTPYTALNLLKAYCPFQTGIILCLKKNEYYSYTSVGLGVERITIPLATLQSEDRPALTFFKFKPGPGLYLDIKNSEENMTYWIFSLNTPAAALPGPWKWILILGVPESSGANSSFDPESVAAVLEGIAEKFILEEELSSADNSSKDISSTDIPNEEQANAEKIRNYHKEYNNFNCIILDMPDSAPEEEKNGICVKIYGMIGVSGTVIQLSENRVLILLPRSIDRELIAHRLSRNIKIKPLLSFESDNPDDALSRIYSLQ